MTRPLHYAKRCALALALALAASGQSSSDLKKEISSLRETVEQLRTEIAILRKNLAYLEFERHRDIARQTRAELEALRIEHSRLAAIDETRQQDLKDLEGLMTREEFNADQRLEIEAARSELLLTRRREIDQQSEAARLREGELLRRLQTEEQLVKRLQEAWKFTGGKTQ